ncbi:MAG: RNA-binding domain-containing protein [Halobacteriota archaeon]
MSENLLELVKKGESEEVEFKKISQKTRQRIKPETSPGIKVLEIEGKTIIEVKIKEGDNKPYYLDGIAYERVGTENVVVPSEELERIILEKRKRYFDSEICEEASLEDIDDEKVRWFLRKAKVERDLDVDENTPVEEALRRLKLIKDGKLTN